MRARIRSQSAGKRGTWGISGLALCFGVLWLGWTVLAAAQEPATPEPTPAAPAAETTPAPAFERTFFETGKNMYRAGKFTEAARYFRVVRFASLETPELQSEVLARLALAEEAAGQKDARTATLQRFVSLQERLGGYEPNSLEPDLRAKFQELVLREVRRERLTQSPELAYEFGLSNVKPPPRPTPTPVPRVAALPTPAAGEPQPGTEPAAPAPGVPQGVPQAAPQSPTSAPAPPPAAAVPSPAAPAAPTPFPAATAGPAPVPPPPTATAIPQAPPPTQTWTPPPAPAPMSTGLLLPRLPRRGRGRLSLPRRRGRRRLRLRL